MHEIELKFQVPAAQRAALDRAVAGRTPQPRVRLQAAYCDTEQRALANARLALRMRREGRQWVQTLKGATDDGMARLEHNVGLGSGRDAPPLDPLRHAGTPAGVCLFAAIRGHPPPPLSVLYRTDIRRRIRVQRSALGRVELAFDTGWITAGDSKLDVLELEFELRAGSPLAVIAEARRWLPRFGLWLDTRSKSERGDLLARGESMAPPRAAAPVVLTPQLSGAEALRRVLGACADQILANASQIASGEHADEHVHQLRIGLRRLRSALRLFEGTPVAAGLQPAPESAPGAALNGAAATLFRRLGGARDQAVIEADFAADLEAALRAAGVSGDAPRAAASESAEVPATVLREAASQGFLLDLLAATQAAVPEQSPEKPPEGPLVAPLAVPVHEPPLRDQLARRLNRWHQRAAADAKRYGKLDDAGRHRLRKHVKRLRYALEFSAALFRPRDVRRYLAALRAAQERLGAINDVVMAMQAFRRSRDTDPRAWFALGWLAARREVLVAQALPDLKKFAGAKRFWRNG